MQHHFVVTIAVGLSLLSGVASPRALAQDRFGEFETLKAADGVFEARHDVEVRLESGVARVETLLRFEHRGRGRSEVLYRLAVPEGAAASSLRVCISGHCRSGIAREPKADEDPYRLAITLPGTSVLPIARLWPLRDARGQYLELRAAPVAPNAPLDVSVVYVATTQVEGGLERLVMPARGEDALAAPATVHASAPRHVSASVEGPTPSPIDAPIIVRAELSPGVVAHASRARCGATECVYVRVASSAAPARRDVVVLLDVSPSMEDVDPRRIDNTLRALLAALTPDSAVRIAQFARGARWAVRERRAPADLDVDALLAATPPNLGNRSSIDRAIELLSGTIGTGALVVVVGDGYTSGAARRLVQLGVEVSTIALGEDPPWTSLGSIVEETHGVVVRPGLLADAGGDELMRRVSLVAAPTAVHALRVSVGVDVTHRALRAGESFDMSFARRGDSLAAISLDGRRVHITDASPSIARGLGVLMAADVGEVEPRRVLTAVHARDFDAAGKWAVAGLRSYPPVRAAIGPPDVVYSLTSFPGGCRRYNGARLCRWPARSSAQTIHCGWGCRLRIRGSLSAEVVRRRMRTLAPAVRACFRRDRAGRLDYSARGSYRLVFRDREVVAADVTGDNLSPALRQCMLDAVDTLVIPRGEAGSLTIVNYPFVTRPVEPGTRH